MGLVVSVEFGACTGVVLGDGHITAVQGGHPYLEVQLSQRGVCPEMVHGEC